MGSIPGWCDQCSSSYPETRNDHVSHKTRVGGRGGEEEGKSLMYQGTVAV